jgi:N-acetylglucosamine kinase-like BadF-type ATPase
VSEATVVGVDIGGTKTHIALANSGRTIAERLLPTREWRVREMATDARRLAGLIRDLAHGAAPAATVVGAHGCDTAAQCRVLRHHLDPLLDGAVEVVNDAELLVPAAGFTEGIGVVAGTGSIAVARLPDRTMLVAGGWGWILGDEGSAPGLVREAARAVRAAVDAGGPAELIADGRSGVLCPPDADAIAEALAGGGHVVVAGPRRTGKTSVCDAVLGRLATLLGLPYQELVDAVGKVSADSFLPVRIRRQ